MKFFGTMAFLLLSFSAFAVSEDECMVYSDPEQYPAGRIQRSNLNLVTERAEAHVAVETIVSNNKIRSFLVSKNVDGKFVGFANIVVPRSINPAAKLSEKLNLMIQEVKNACISTKKITKKIYNYPTLHQSYFLASTADEASRRESLAETQRARAVQFCERVEAPELLSYSVSYSSKQVRLNVIEDGVITTAWFNAGTYHNIGYFEAISCGAVPE